MHVSGPPQVDVDIGGVAGWLQPMTAGKQRAASQPQPPKPGAVADRGAMASKEAWKAAGRHVPAAGSTSGIPASAYNPISGTFHQLDPSVVTVETPALPLNGRYKPFGEGDDAVGVGPELDTMSNAGSCSEESEDQQKERAQGPGQGGLPGAGPSTRTQAKEVPGAVPLGGAVDKRDKMRAKNEKKHQRQKEKRAQELKEKCLELLTARKLKALAGQLMAMGFSRDQATAALVATDGHVERSVAWIVENPDSASKDGQASIGKLKLDIGEELARIAEMEIRYGYARSEIERCIVLADGDLDKALAQLQEKQPHVATPPDTASPGSSAPASPGMSLGSSPVVNNVSSHHGRLAEMAHANGGVGVHLSANQLGQFRQLVPGVAPQGRANGTMQPQHVPPAQRAVNGGLSQAMHDLRKDDGGGQPGQARWQQSNLAHLPSQGSGHPPSQARYAPPAPDIISPSSKGGYAYANGALDAHKLASPGTSPLMTHPSSIQMHRAPYGNAHPYQATPRFAQDSRGALGPHPASHLMVPPAAPRLHPSTALLAAPQRPLAPMQRAPVLAMQQQQVTAGMLPGSPGVQGWSNGHMHQQPQPGAQQPQPGLLAGLQHGAGAEPFWKGNPAIGAQQPALPLPTRSQPTARPPLFSVPEGNSQQQQQHQQQFSRAFAASGWADSVPREKADGGQVASDELTSSSQPKNGLPVLPSVSELITGWGSGTGTSAAIAGVDWSTGVSAAPNMQAVDWSIGAHSQKPQPTGGLYSLGLGSLSLQDGSGAGASAEGGVASAGGSREAVGTYDLWGGPNGGAAGNWPVPTRSTSEPEGLGQAAQTLEWSTPFGGKDLFLQHSTSAHFR